MLIFDRTTNIDHLILTRALLQIGVKTECRSNLARLALFYGNKTNHPFLNFQPVVTASPVLGMAILLQVKQVDSTVEAGAQFQQVTLFYWTSNI